MYEVRLQHFNETEASVFMRDPNDLPGSDRFHLVYTGRDQFGLCENPQIAPVSFVRSLGTPAPVGRYSAGIVAVSGVIAWEKYFVWNGRQEISFVGCSMLRRGETLGVFSRQLIRMSRNAFD